MQKVKQIKVANITKLLKELAINISITDSLLLKFSDILFDTFDK